MKLWSLIILSVLIGCDGEQRQRDSVDSDANVVDAGLPDLGRPDVGDSDAIPPDISPPDSGGDSLVPDARLPGDDAGLAVPEECNGEDDDLDGTIDEGVANACGGCGGLPPEGCQAWRINLLQNEEGLANPNRAVGLLGAAIGVSERSIEGAECELLRVPPVHPDGHLGQVNIDGPQINLNLGPVYDERRGYHTYFNTPEIGRSHIHDGGDVLTVRAGGGRSVGPFELELEAPAGIEGIIGEALAPIAARARGEDMGDVPLVWTPAPPAQSGRLRLFVGGSVPIFTTNNYRAIQYYQLDVSLEDDGDWALPADLFTGVPASSVWVYMARERALRRPIGPHVVEFNLGTRIEARAAGILENDQPPPFQIVSPSPNTRAVVPGEPLEISWSALPPGEGPLLVTLTTADARTGMALRVTCEIIDPASGSVTFPADFTETWPRTTDDFRQLAMRWETRTRTIDGPDPALLTEAFSVLLKLDGCQEDVDCEGPGRICEGRGCRDGCRADDDCDDLTCGEGFTCR